MIGKKELRIGNYLLHGNTFCDVCQILEDELHVFGEFENGEKGYWAASLESLSPIPLSPEILEKLGFTHEGKPSVINGQDFYQVYSYGIFTFNSNHEWWVNNWNLPVQPKYLHELQNLYWCLCGEELEVKGI